MRSYDPLAQRMRNVLTDDLRNRQLIYVQSERSLIGYKECAMLVLTRKPKEVIQIGENITVTIVRIKGQTVRVGISAPRDVRVIRGELTAFEDGDKSETVNVDVSSHKEQRKPVAKNATAPRPCSPDAPAPRLPKSDRFQNQRPGLTAFGLLAARERARREQSQLDT